jgi:DNA/RNA-binding domain of Phe-tRNA-synthetase-like protein
MLTIDDHPLLDLRTLVTTWDRPLGEVETPPWLGELADLEADTGLPVPDDGLKKAIRDLLRHGGFKPAGRNKPCSEYIRAAAGKGYFPAINPAVDACNLACLHGGVPVSLVDPDLLQGSPRVGIAGPNTSYVFNASGQEIRLDGLLCLFDDEGPCANAVKDSQRIKTHPGTTRTLSLLWGTQALPGKVDEVLDWYQGVVERLGGRITSR